MIGLHYCAGFLSSCSVMASHFSGFSCCGAWASVVMACGFSSCGSQALEAKVNSCGAWAKLLWGMWDLPRPGIEPVSPALAGGFFTTEPPGKPARRILNQWTTREVPPFIPILFCLVSPTFHQERFQTQKSWKISTMNTWNFLDSMINILLNLLLFSLYAHVHTHTLFLLPSYLKVSCKC